MLPLSPTNQKPRCNKLTLLVDFEVIRLSLMSSFDGIFIEIKEIWPQKVAEKVDND